jgi:hemerythrin-like metal-binding protein
MAIVEWSDDFRIGERETDQEHWGLFMLINDLADKRTSGVIESSVAATIEALVAYVGVHFEHEERLMQQNGYPGFEAHKGIHEELARRVGEFRDVFQRAPKSFDHEELMVFLTNWLKQHILEKDMEFAAFFKKKQLSN